MFLVLFCGVCANSPDQLFRIDINGADGSQATTRDYPPEPVRDAVRIVTVSEAP